MTKPRYSKVICKVTYHGETLSSVPFVIDEAGRPFEPLNVFVRENFDHWHKRSGSVGQTVDRVLMFFQLLSRNNRDWDEPAHHYVGLYLKELEKTDLAPETINAHTDAIYAFYWMCEERGFCNRLIGINDVDNDDYRFPLRVLHHNSPRQEYANPFRKKGKNKTLRPRITGNKDWESAIEKALDANTSVGARDAMLMSLILYTGARRVEALSLKVDAFRENVSTDQPYVHRTVLTKLYETRDLRIPREIYLEVRDFINEERPELIADLRKRDAGFVFCGERGTGDRLTNSHISNRLQNTYGVIPSDGRSTFATNLMIELLREGFSQESAILYVRQLMGHSPNDQTAQTLRGHYLQAKAILEAEDKGTLLEQAHKENADLKALIAKRDEKIDQLIKQIESLESSQAGSR